MGNSPKYNEESKKARYKSIYLILSHDVQNQVKLSDGGRSQNRDYLDGDGVMVETAGRGMREP